MSTKSKDQAATIADDAELDGDTLPEVGEGDGEGSQAQDLVQGSYLGRYMILDCIGRGGMGVVYKAYDPELDRRVALKLLSVKRDSETAALRSRERLLREAQALARLSHPNVVSAYDVGVVGEDVFVAMELVEGKTLPAWVKSAQPSIREKIEVMIAAGRGIAAAHAAGLIHRDIKPDNILVGDDGRVRVLDFGLARASAATESVDADDDEATTPNSELSSSGDWLNRPETVAGTIMGTPGYMAPEQYMGADLDEQTDQYSFCITLYEVLYGAKPHKAKTYVELKQKMTSEPIKLPATANVPKKLRTIVMRGLSLIKEDRYPSMNALLALLAHDPKVMRKRLALAVAAVILLAAGFGGAAIMEARGKRKCQGAEQRVAQVWHDGVRSQVRQSFQDSGRHYAMDTFGRLEKLFDRYAEQWAGMWTQACEATHVSGVQSERMLDLRMRCLRQRLDEAQALVHLFRDEVDGEVVDRAVEAASGLFELESCADKELLTATVMPPADPAMRQKVDEVRKLLRQAEAFQKTGKYQRAKTDVLFLLHAAEKTKYAPLLAEILLFLGALQNETGDVDGAEQSLVRAATLAGRSRKDDLLARTVTVLVGVIGGTQARFTEARMLATLARAEVERAGGAAELRADLFQTQAALDYHAGKYELARELFQQVLAIREELFGKDDIRVTAALIYLANTVGDQGKLQQAMRYIERALAIRQRDLGKDHPLVADSLNSLGMALLDQGKIEQAQQILKKAEKIWEKSHGKQSLRVSKILVNLGMCARKAGQLSEARNYFERALSIQEEILPANSQDIARVLNNLGITESSSKHYPQAMAYLERTLAIHQTLLGEGSNSEARVLNNMGVVSMQMGELEQALGYFKRNIAILQKTVGEEHPRLYRTIHNLANLLASLGRHRQAEKNFDRAQRGLEKTLGARHPDVAFALSDQGEYYLGQNRLKPARQKLERALAIRQETKVNPASLAMTRFLLAKTLWQAGQERDRALALAIEAKEAWSQIDAAIWIKYRQEAEAWLAQRRK